MNEEEKLEGMFEKALTPSDVGKLNRLVIPKQHAERYFPLDSEEIKGLLLSFEDESGKCWRFRYSYWNSSQSYVLTKGWSRYVKDKHLLAGDVVFFQRFRSFPHRFFISSTRRHPPLPLPHLTSFHHAQGGGSQSQNTATCTSSSTSSSSSSSSRVLRLFGVNMECQPDNDSQTLTPEQQQQQQCSYNNNNNVSTTPHFYQHLHRQSSNPPHHHMLRQQPY